VAWLERIEGFVESGIMHQVIFGHLGFDALDGDSIFLFLSEASHSRQQQTQHQT
jgi:hypothetical protein